MPNGASTEYKWLTYTAVNERLTWFGSGLLDLYQKNVAKSPGPLSGWHLGLYSINRPEWVIAEQAANAYSLVTVALYDTLGADTLSFTVNHAELPVIVCSYDKITNLLKVAHLCPRLKVIISLDRFDAGKKDSLAVLRAWALEKGIMIISFEEIETIGKQKPLAHIPPKADDLATICYTSGTTGEPKGAMILHKNFIASGHSVDYIGLDLTPTDCMISYLPLAHCFERVLQAAVYHVGASVGFYRGDVLTLVEDIACLKPTIFPSVPRLFNRIYAKLVQGTLKAPGVKGYLCRQGYSTKLKNLHEGKGLANFFWDKLLFGKVAAVLGGRVRVMVSGSAPISGDVLNFLRLMFSCEILEGYGQTECAAGSTITCLGDYVPSQVGVPLACNEIKLVAVPEMNYLPTDKQPRGEVCIRGSNVMKGYYKDDEKTRETIDQDGWLHTGDIGMITPTGTLAIIDRKKNIFKLAQGEYIAVEKLESVYQKSSYIAQVYVHGDSLQSEVVAIIVPEPDKAIQWASKNMTPFESSCKLEEKLAKIASNPAFKKFLLDQIQYMGKQYKLAGFEIVKNIFIENDAFTMENDLLTPSFKLKRNIAIKKYRSIFDQLYTELNAAKDTIEAKL